MIKVHEKKSTILNCLDIRLKDKPLDTVVGLATDYWAELSTAAHPGFFGRLAFGAKRWGLVATQHACSLGHMDTQGVMTYLRILAGSKFWIMALPEKGSSFGSIDTFGKEYDEQYFSVPL